ncbi:anti-sigma regulatory factor (Ser/Thr protein kinase) [Streptomyces sp. V3I8]|uniref:ATP-binding protein n=1 Tax=Streptomyces sp. V3I8 TaxID=3042279 RepID=UPI00277F161A|nr:ATP-binding protein [Streptomyces sp. V3I8]MDQ1035532.1 anti-sigma regulatory factor (Ser/Thr protein kinase) [Streptomyces sp. V3I8]
MAPPSLPKPWGRLPADEPPQHRSGAFGVPPIPASVGLARRNVRELLSAWGTDPEACDNAVLVTSELVTNALTHTASKWVVCRLRTDGHRLHLEVEDQNRGLAIPAQRTAGPDDQGGRGLLLVGTLSSDWGVRDTAHGSGRVVWAVLPARPVLSPAPSAVPAPAEPRDLASTGLTPAARLTRPTPHSAEGSLPHGTAARP